MEKKQTQKNGVNKENKENKEQMEFDEEEKRRGRLLWLFVLNFSGVCLSFMLLVIYTNVVLRTLEKRFGLSSFQTGLLSSSNDIMQIALVVFIAYFGHKGNKPRIISITVLFSSVAGFLMASPHFFLHDYETSFSSHNNSSSSNSSNFCLTTNNHNNCSSSHNEHIHPAFYVFLTAQFITGIGASALYTLSMAYIDENAPANTLSLYIAVFMCMFSFSPTIGMLLAGFCLNLPENLFSGDAVESDDPAFVGCWWLGYIIAASLLTIFAIPLSFFPPNLKKKTEMGDPRKEKLLGESEVEMPSLSEQAKAFPKALLRLLKNKVYILNLCQIVCGAYTIYGMYVNLVRYIETHFLYSAAVASIISGVASSTVGAIGSLCSGVLVNRFKPNTKQAMKLIILCGMVYVGGVLILLNISCPQVQMDMTFNGDPYQSRVTNGCNDGCNCALDRKSYSPVCGSNGISYYSPCLAGCSLLQNNTYTNCTCLRTQTSNHTQYDYRSDGGGMLFVEGTATPGFCTPKCGKFVLFTVVLVFMSIFTSITRVPGTMINLNIVNDDERSFALGINSFVLNLLGFIPSPLLFGRLIDDSCILWQWSCSQRGACLLFDTARLRKSIYGPTCVVEILELCFFIGMLYYIPKRALQTRYKDVQLEVKEEDLECKLKGGNEDVGENMMEMGVVVLNGSKIGGDGGGEVGGNGGGEVGGNGGGEVGGNGGIVLGGLDVVLEQDLSNNLKF